MKADLHVHSKFSDGLYSIEELKELKKEKNIDIIAITDHDCIECIKYDGIIHGIELSTRYNDEDIHVLGYFKNLNNLEELSNYLLTQKQNRTNRLYKIKDLLKEVYDIEIDYSNLDLENKIVGRPQVAELIAKKLNISMPEAFNRYLLPGMPCYITSAKISLIDGVNLLKRANCICFIAHPILYKTDALDLIKYADGLEAIYPKNNKENTLYFKGISKIYTAGSDFHGDLKHDDLGTCFLSDVELNNFLKLLNN